MNLTYDELGCTLSTDGVVSGVVKGFYEKDSDNDALGAEVAKRINFHERLVAAIEGIVRPNVGAMHIGVETAIKLLAELEARP